MLLSCMKVSDVPITITEALVEMERSMLQRLEQLSPTIANSPLGFESGFFRKLFDEFENLYPNFKQLQDIIEMITSNNEYEPLQTDNPKLNVYVEEQIRSIFKIFVKFAVARNLLSHVNIEDNQKLHDYATELDRRLKRLRGEVRHRGYDFVGYVKSNNPFRLRRKALYIESENNQNSDVEA